MCDAEFTLCNCRMADFFTRQELFELFICVFLFMIDLLPQQKPAVMLSSVEALDVVELSPLRNL